MVTEVELVTDSVIEVDHVSISGLPIQIPDGHVTRISSLVVPGPFNPGTALYRHPNLSFSLTISDYTPSLQFIGFILDAAIERVQFRGLVFGNAQVTRKVFSQTFYVNIREK